MSVTLRTNTSEYELRQARDCEGRYSHADQAHWVVWHRGDRNGMYSSWSKAAAARVLMNYRRKEARVRALSAADI